MARAITTADDLLRAGDIGRCELIRGKLRMMLPADYQHGRIAALLAALIGRHVKPRRLGVLCAAGTGFLLSRDPDTVRAPDLAFIRADRSDLSDGYYPGAPDLAVEVLEPVDRPGYVREKVAEWLEAGTRGSGWSIRTPARSRSTSRSASHVSSATATRYPAATCCPALRSPSPRSSPRRVTSAPGR